MDAASASLLGQSCFGALYMLLFDLTRLTLCTTLATAPVAPAAPMTAAIEPDTSIVTMTDTAQVLVTPEIMTRMTAFVSSYFKIPKTTLDSSMLFRMMVPMPAMHLRNIAPDPVLPPLNAADMGMFSDKSPTVAAEFKKAGITPQDYMRWRRSLLAAYYMYAMDQVVNKAASGIDTSTVLGKNADFLRTHQTEFKALGDAGMPFPQFQMTMQQQQPMGVGSPMLPTTPAPTPAPAPTK